MAITQVERMRATVTDPALVGSVGNKIISVNYSSSWVSPENSTASIYDIETNVSLVYTAPASRTVTPAIYNGKMYFGWTGAFYAYCLYSIASNGEVSMVPSSYIGTGQALNYWRYMTYCDGYIVGNTMSHKLSDNTTRTTGVLGVPFSNGTDLFVKTSNDIDSTVIKRVNPADGSQIGDSITFVEASQSSGAIVNGDYLYIALSGSAQAFKKIKFSNGEISSIVPTPSGYPYSAGSYKFGSDGYIYGIVNASSIVILDPETGRWKIETLAPTRTNRYGLAIGSNGKIYIPSGKPDTWV